MRGGLGAAAAFLRRAVALTEDPQRRAERSVDAADASLRSGAFEAASQLLDSAEAGPLVEFQRARVDLLRGHVAFASGLGRDAPRLLLKAAGELEPFDPQLARETYLNAWAAAGMAEDVVGDGALMEICRAVQALPPPPGARGPLDLLVDGLALLITDGPAAATATLQQAAKALVDLPVEDVLRWGWMAAAAFSALWDIEGMHAICARQVQLVRDAGALALLPLCLAQLGIASPWMGDFEATASLIAETDSVAVATESPIAPYTLLILRALQGSEAAASTAIASVVEQAAAGGPATAAAWAHRAAAILYNGLGRYDEAASAAQRASSSTVVPYQSMWALPELIEAAARAGDREVARDALERLAESTQPSGTDLACGIEARCRALLSEGETAERLYEEAIDRLRHSRMRPELARAHLLYGEWLRRENRRVEARAQLRAGYDQFASIGMEAFAARARRELLATGEKVRKRTIETRVELTAQERQVSILARDGLSNPEIGARLFVSPRTVEYHLGKVFSKLAISSRRELGTALPPSESELAGA
jgi:DNA-binding CsgD family transcriptional regulator/tetratricopeptide (TPR) repeat protein